METEDIHEITELEATKVAGVASPANRTPFVMLKAKGKPNAKAGPDNMDEDAKDAFAANTERMKAGKPVGKAEADDIEDALTEGVEDDVTKAEADEIEVLVTKAERFCGDPGCELCVKAELVPLQVRTSLASGLSKETLSATQRKKMPSSSFAYTDPKGGKHLPVHDSAHVQAALGRFGQTDFSGADDPAGAKRKAAGKILAAAGKHGVEVGDDTDVAQAAKKGAVQDALQGTKMPEEAGHLVTGQSGLAGAATGAPKAGPSTVPEGRQPTSVSGVTTRLEGGESAYPVNAEGKAYTVANAQPVVAVKAVASLFEAMAQIEEERKAQKDGRYLTVPGPTPEQTSVPGSMPWESYDSATLDQVASVLAGCVNAVECICVREQIEALTNDPSDAQDAYDLSCAQQCLDQAMGIVARLAYAEGAEMMKSGDVVKAYRRLKVADEKALRDAHAALSTVLDEHDRKVAQPGQSPSEGDKIQMELTKDELAEQVSAGVEKAISDREKAARKAAKVKKQEARERKAQKAKIEKMAVKKAKKIAKKNANNGGDIDLAGLKAGVKGETQANDVGAVGAPTKPEYMNKGEKDPAITEMQDTIKALGDQVAAVGNQVKKFGKRPRSGGPILDGQGGEARQLTGIAKSAGSEQDGQALKSLQEAFESTSDPINKQELGFKITHAQLMAAHNSGQI